MANSDVGFIYDKIGKDFSRTRQSNWPEVKEYLKMVRPGQSVLDLGCGNGRLNFDLPSEIDYTGVDISEVLTVEAARMFPKRKFILGDILQYQGEKKYDVIFCIAVMHHMERDEVERVTGVIRENLGNEGFVVITCWNLWQRRYWKYHLKSWRSKLRDWRRVTVPYQKTDRECVAWTIFDLKRIIGKYDFSQSKIYFSERKRWWEARNLMIYLRK